MRFFIAICLSFLATLSAQEGDSVSLSKGSVYEGDYFATGGSIEVAGTVNGDVYVFGTQIIVSGQVAGDVISAGSSIEISGNVQGNARIAAGRIIINGNVGRNVTAAGGNVQIDSSAQIGRSALISASSALVAGRIGGDLKAYVSELDIEPTTSIQGSVQYTSSETAKISPEVYIGGGVRHVPSAVSRIFQGKWKRKVIVGSKATGLLMNFVFSFVIGWILLRLFPKKTRVSLKMIGAHPWRSLGIGTLVFFLLPLACLILFITILGFPIALALLAFSLLTFYAAKIFSILFVANHFFPRVGMKESSLPTLALGLVLFFLITMIPFFGGVLSFVATLIGIGGAVLSRTTRGGRKRSAKT